MSFFGIFHRFTKTKVTEKTLSTPLKSQEKLEAKFGGTSKEYYGIFQSGLCVTGGVVWISLYFRLVLGILMMHQKSSVKQRLVINVIDFNVTIIFRLQIFSI